MTGVTPHEAERFYEEDEDPAQVFALFDAGQKSQTQRPAPPGLAARPGKLTGLRQRLAGALRRAADVIEPRSMTRQRRAAQRPH